MQLQYENFYIWTEGQQSQDDNSNLVIFTSGAGQTITPFIGNKSDAQGALEAVTKIINPLNEINQNFKNFLGSGLSMNILPNLTSKLTALAVGNVFYCLENDNQYLLISNLGLSENLTLQDAIDLNAAKNITPSKFGSVWVNFSSTKTLPDISGSSVGSSVFHKNNTDYNILLNLTVVGGSSNLGYVYQYFIDNILVGSFGVGNTYAENSANILVPPNAIIEIKRKMGNAPITYIWSELLDSSSSQGLELITNL